MRYREGQPPDPQNPYTENMHASLMVSVSLALVIGIILFFAGRKGKKLWLSTWSVGLVLCSLLYFGLRFSGYA